MAAPSRYVMKQRPGALIEASRDMKKNKRAVMKAIGMPMKSKKRKALPSIKVSGSFQGKSNALGQGGRAAQLKARGVPGGVIGNLARRAQAAPGQKNFHKKAKSSTSLVKAPNSRYVRKTAKKGSMSLAPSPKSHRSLRTKKARKNFVADGSFGDEKLQGTKLEHAREKMRDVKKSAKRRKHSASALRGLKNFVKEEASEKRATKRKPAKKGSSRA